MEIFSGINLCKISRKQSIGAVRNKEVDKVKTSRKEQKPKSVQTCQNVFSGVEKATQKQAILAHEIDEKVVFEKLKEPFNLEYYIGKEIEGIRITKEMVDKIREVY